MNKIEAAVAPLKAQAIIEAEKQARKIIGRVQQELEAAGWDRKKAAPRPDAFRSSRSDYKQGMAKVRLFEMLTRSEKGSYRMDEPVIVHLHGPAIDKFIEDSKIMAASSYDSYVAKLIHKIGDVISAELSGAQVWGKSLLTIAKPDGTKQVWKTQQILNFSGLGTPYHQWPTRQIKAPA